MRSQLYYASYLAIQLIRIILFLLTLIIFISALKPFFEDYESNSILQSVYSVDSKISEKVDPPLRKSIPTMIGMKDATPWIKILVLMMLTSFLARYKNTCKYYSQYHKQKAILKELKNNHKIPANNPAMVALESKMKAVESSTKRSESSDLLENYIALKKQIEARIRPLSFLSIDIVGSTQMKENEEKTKIQYDFLQYNKNVKMLLNNNHSLKASWTPDGVMAAFNTSDDAVNAAKEIIEFVKKFNHELKTMNHDFHVRYGIHCGDVYYDDSLNLEEITDEVIDIAGHLQKNGEHDKIMVSDVAYESLGNKSGFSKNDLAIDGVTVYQF